MTSQSRPPVRFGGHVAGVSAWGGRAPEVSAGGARDDAVSDLRHAAEHMASAGLLLERAEISAPHYSVDALRFVRAELGVCRRRLGNLRKVLGDLDHTPSASDSLGPLSAGGGESPRGPDPAPSGPDLVLRGTTHGPPAPR